MAKVVIQEDEDTDDDDDFEDEYLKDWSSIHGITIILQLIQKMTLKMKKQE